VTQVRLGRAIEDHWLILDGVKPGDRVIVEGFQKFESGDRVSPKPWRDEGRAGEELPRSIDADAHASTR
jgi:membrane fusion protein, multidrug efflux system